MANLLFYLYFKLIASLVASHTILKIDLKGEFTFHGMVFVCMYSSPKLIYPRFIAIGLSLYYFGLVYGPRTNSKTQLLVGRYCS